MYEFLIIDDLTKEELTWGGAGCGWFVFEDWLGPLMKDAAGMYPTWIGYLDMLNAEAQLGIIAARLNRYTNAMFDADAVAEARDFILRVLDACVDVPLEIKDRARLYVRLET